MIDISEIIKAIPELSPHLRGRAGAIFCETKSLARDDNEPGVVQKRKFERKLQNAIRRRFERQFADLIRRMQESGYKTITIPGASVPDDAGENAELVEIFVQAILDGIVLFEDDTNTALNDVLSGQLAEQWARSYVTEWLAQLDASTQDAVRQAVTMFIDTPGTTLADVEKAISKYFDIGRAQRIAVTEITRAFAQGNQIAGQQLKQEFPTMTVYKRWYTNRDDRVCPICGPLNNKKVGIDESWESQGKTIDNPPAHVNCRCWTGVTIDV